MEEHILDIWRTNISAFRLINDLGKDYDFLNPSFVFIAEYLVYFLALSVLLFWFTRNNKNRLMVISGGITFIVAEVVGKLIGQLHYNIQPFAYLEDVNKLIEKTVGNSFPSDHTILFFSFCITFFLFKTKFRYLWLMLALLVAVSRIWVGVHYPLDVTVGALISTIFALIIFFTIPNFSLTKNFLLRYEKIENRLLPSKRSKDV